MNIWSASRRTTAKYEAGGAAVLGSIQPQPIEADTDGTLPLDKLAAAIKPDDIHCPHPAVEPENTISGGGVLPQAYRRRGSLPASGSWRCIDGARIFNAAVALNLPLKEIVQYCDTFTICLSKGLAPVGSPLPGGSEAFIRERAALAQDDWRRLRQAGIWRRSASTRWSITSRGCAKTMTTRSG